MSESLLSRVGRLVSGTANSIVDTVESTAPDIIMKQAVRELDNAVEDVRDALGKAAVKKHVASQRLAETNKSHEELSEKIGIALKANEKDLARAAVARQMDLEAQIPILEKTIADAGDEEQELNSSILALQGRKREMTEQLDAYIAQKSAALKQDAEETAGGERKLNSTVDNANSAFERAMKAATGVSTGFNNTSAADSAKLAKLDQMTRDHRVEERLAALEAELE
ncbi:phage shock protein PspA [Pseudovibrio axinellae]|uniref:Phage shock protein PspA n=1 Tax=Pseudovibrio axinellae TaxID=989403 RepID=A0A165XQX3_9HYPH|nr:PspA/IM30 family protein [Pseudovibrio axinellae]KZL17954.1 phage shock protein PspA [Pseudovibrio axinellae]SER15456.1 phage shock protein A (PspA) family protein [Pseudovibrio axinellae]